MEKLNKTKFILSLILLIFYTPKIIKTIIKNKRAKKLNNDSK